MNMCFQLTEQLFNKKKEKRLRKVLFVVITLLTSQLFEIQIKAKGKL